MFASAVDVIVQVERLRDGSRKVTRIAEVTGGEGGDIRLRSLLSYDMGNGDPRPGAGQGGRHVLVNAPSEDFMARTAYFGEGARMALVLQALSGADKGARFKDASA
jgi:hypothetical protein